MAGPAARSCPPTRSSTASRSMPPACRNRHRAGGPTRPVPGSLVGMHGFQRYAPLSLGQVGPWRMYRRSAMASASRSSSASGSSARSNTITCESICGCRASGNHRCGTQARGREALRHVQHRGHRHHVQHGRGEALVAQAQGVVPQARLCLLEQAGQADRRAHVAQCLVGVADAQAVGHGQVFQLEGGSPCRLRAGASRCRPAARHGSAASRPACPSVNRRLAIRVRKHRGSCDTGRGGRIRRRSAASSSQGCRFPAATFPRRCGRRLRLR